jgi:hypothetical protein
MRFLKLYEGHTRVQPVMYTPLTQRRAIVAPRDLFIYGMSVDGLVSPHMLGPCMLCCRDRRLPIPTANL